MDQKRKRKFLRSFSRKLMIRLIAAYVLERWHF
jgi:hypothetical protein